MPAAILPSDLNASLRIIDNYLKNPIDLKGKKASQFLSSAKRSKRRRRRSGDESEDDGVSTDEEETKKTKQRKKKEEIKYKSAQFIEDSDAEFDEDAFFAKEREKRELNEKVAQEGKVVAMKATGTKKRRRKGEGDAPKKKAKASSGVDTDHIVDKDPGESSASDAEDSVVTKAKAPAKRPRPKPRPRKSIPQSPGDNTPTVEDGDGEGSLDGDTVPSAPKAARKRPKPRPRLSVQAGESSDAFELEGGIQTSPSSPAASSPRNVAEQSSVEVDSDLEAMSLKPIKKPRKLVFSDEEDDD
jgi:replication fork protection complex subunit Tof1/Swi1